MQIGVLGTILVHLLLILIVPRLELASLTGGTAAPGQADPQGNTFNIEMDAEQFLMPSKPEPPPMKFVETNPDAPDNPPDKTNNFSSQNQQVAQEKPTPDGKSDTPASKGDEDKQSSAIVSGSLAPPQPSVPPTPQASEENEQEQEEQKMAREEKVPISGFEKVTGDNAQGIGSNIAKVAPHPSEADEAVDGVKNGAADGATTGVKFKIDPKRPQTRPVLSAAAKQVRPAPLLNNEFGTSNIGPVAYDAKWSSYGEYLRKLIDTVQVQWDRIIVQSAVYPPAGSKVSVKFIINSKGEIADIVPVDTNAGKQATSACVAAITARAPYGEWTDDMLAVLGTQQEMTFTFYYY